MDTNETSVFREILETLFKLTDITHILSYPYIVRDKLSDSQFAELEAIAEDRCESIRAEQSPSGIEYPVYDHSQFKVASKSWQSLNPQGFTYWEWLYRVGLPMFWKQPRQELQHKLLAICCAINTNAVPYRNANARKECSVPLLYFFGDSGSGKTEGNMIISQSYPHERTSLIKGEATGCALRNLCHALCFREGGGDIPGKNNLFPAFLLIDNYEPGFLARWGEHKTILLSVLRSQGYTSVADREGGNRYYYTHLLKSFTSVIAPKSMNLAQAEFNRRFIYFFTAKSNEVKSIGNYDFSDIPKLYNEFWCKDRVVEQFYPLMATLLGKDDNETSIPAHRWGQSVLVIGVGVLIGAFKDIEEGIEFMTEYWSWVENELESSTTEVSIAMDTLIEQTLIKWSQSTLMTKTDEELLNNPSCRVILLIKDIRDMVKRVFLDSKGKEGQCTKYLKDIKKWGYATTGTGNDIRAVYYLTPLEAIKALEAIGYDPLGKG